MKKNFFLTTDRSNLQRIKSVLVPQEYRKSTGSFNSSIRVPCRHDTRRAYGKMLMVGVPRMHLHEMVPYSFDGTFNRLIIASLGVIY